MRSNKDNTKAKRYNKITHLVWMINHMENLEEWIFGVARNERGKIVSFFAKSSKKNNILKKYDSRGSEIIEYHYRAFKTFKDAESEANRLYDQYSVKLGGEGCIKIQSGSVVDHIDGGKIHQAIVLDVDSADVLALFLTTNPHWNHYCRKITKEEAVLIGFYGSIVETYLAPVIRSINDFVITNGSLFPDFRINDLRKELPWSVADDC